MHKRLPGSLLSFLALFAAVATAQAGVLNDVSRYLGWGWSDGYHSRNVSPAASPPPVYYMPSPAPRVNAPAPTMPAAPTASPMPIARKTVPVLPSRTATPRTIPLSR